MSHFAAAVVRDVNGWTAAELDITGSADVDDVAERLRDVDPNAKVSLLFVESDDTFLAIVRLDEGDDLRVFGSDSAFVTETRIGQVLLADADEPEAAPTDEDKPHLAGPVGDVDLLSDLGVPGEDGYSLIRKVRSRPASLGGDVPAAALTAYVRAEDRRQALAAGFQAHLAKPIDPSDLVATVARLAGR